MIFDKLNNMLNEDMSALGGIASTVGGVIKGVADVAKKIKSAVGTKINKLVDLLDSTRFTSLTGARDLKELDRDLSLIPADSDELDALLYKIFIKMKAIKKDNKDMYDQINKVYERHFNRSLDYIITIMHREKDPQKGKLYYSQLVAALNQIDKKENEGLFNKIIDAISDHLDDLAIKQKTELKRPEVKKTDVEMLLGKDIKILRAEDIKKLIGYYETMIDEAKRNITTYAANGMDEADLKKAGNIYDMAAKVKTLKERLPKAK